MFDSGLAGKLSVEMQVQNRLVVNQNLFFNVCYRLSSRTFKLLFRTFHIPTTEFVMNETVKSSYRCCEGWSRDGNELGCTLSESLLWSSVRSLMWLIRKFLVFPYHHFHGVCLLESHHHNDPCTLFER